MFLINIGYPNRIKKSELKKLIKNKDIKSFIDLSNLENNIIQAKKFKPKSINNKNMEDYVDDFFNMISGISDNEIDDNNIFQDGKWIK